MAWHTTRPSPTWSRSWRRGASRCCAPRSCSPAARTRARTCCRPGWSGCCGTGPAIDGDPEGYLRRTLYNLAADGWRRQRAWRQRLRLLQNETASSVGDGTSEVDARDTLIRLLVQLPPRQRAVIVARYWEQLSEAETAMVLGCSVGSVKASASRGLQRLRELSGTSTRELLWQRRRRHEHRL